MHAFVARGFNRWGRGSARVSHRGSVLISAIMVLLVLVGLVAALAPVVRVDVRAAGEEGEALQARCLARAGVALALATLERDDPGVDGQEDEWVTLGTGGQEEFQLGPGWFRVEVIDASSRIDLNRADRATLLRLPGIDEATVDEILAWRGSGAVPEQEDAAGSGADYEGLPRPYRLKEAPFDSVEELLLVQGVTPSLLYGPRDGSGSVESVEDLPWIDLLFVGAWSPNQDAEGQERVDLSTATANQFEEVAGDSLRPEQARAIVQWRDRSGPFASLADLLSVPGVPEAAVRSLMDRVTLEPGPRLIGRVNVNTASAEALEILLGVTTEVAEQIVERREAEGAIQSVGDLLDLGEDAFRSLVDRVTTKSAVFIVRARGELENGAYRAVEVWVRREAGRARVIRWREVPRWPGWDAWGWEPADLQ
jgi:DNA uptake protein ComE-like DNA-binding protein